MARLRGSHILFAALLLAGCETTDTPDEGAVAASVGGPALPDRSAGRTVVGAEPAAAKPAPDRAARRPRGPAGQEAVAAAPPFDPETLVGKDFAGVTALLGAPEAKAEEPPAEVWSWTGTGCHLRVFFFLDMESRQPRALAYEVEGSEEERDACLAGLRAGAPSGGAS